MPTRLTFPSPSICPPPRKKASTRPCAAQSKSSTPPSVKKLLRVEPSTETRKAPPNARAPKAPPRPEWGEAAPTATCRQPLSSPAIVKISNSWRVGAAVSETSAALIPPPSRARRASARAPRRTLLRSWRAPHSGAGRLHPVHRHSKGRAARRPTSPRRRPRCRAPGITPAARRSSSKRLASLISSTVTKLCFAACAMVMSSRCRPMKTFPSRSASGAWNNATSGLIAGSATMRSPVSKGFSMIFQSLRCRGDRFPKCRAAA